MIKGKGLSVYEGIAIGKTYLYKKTEVTDALSHNYNGVEAELKSFENVLIKAKEDLNELYERTKTEIGEEEAAIIEVQALMLDDDDFTDGIRGYIKSGLTAVGAVLKHGQNTADEFSAMEDEYFKARSADVLDITNRLSRILNNESDDKLSLSEPVILIADDLSPSETIQLPKDKILAFVTSKGSLNSHTAILARTLNIPALVQSEIDLIDENNDVQMVVDGVNGVYYINPDEDTLNAAKTLKLELDGKAFELERYRGVETVTKSGIKINLYANIGSSEDAETAVKNDAEGVGLMRSEFLYLGRDTEPTEDELFAAYKRTIENLQGRKLIIRTLDIGADKKVSYFNMPEEENPALGVRGVRFYKVYADTFKRQMRAIYRASVFGKVSVMFPMIISVKEVRELKAMCEEAKFSLKAEGTAFNDFEFGIMIETPAAALVSDSLAQEVDFFSVGTNDLIQYTLALDRQNSALSDIYDADHGAIIALLEMIATNANNAGIWAGVCGELAGDLSFTKRLVEMGYKELSVSSGKILSLRAVINNL